MLKPHVVSLFSSSHGTGKTTLAASLAAVFAAERPVRLVDADAEEREPGHLDALLQEPWDGLTLVDGPPLPTAGGERVLARSELVLVPVAVGDLDIPGARKIVDACSRAKRRTLVVL